MDSGRGDLNDRKPRVLIVDNDARTRNSNQFLLRQWGYEPVVTSGDGRELYKNALDEAKRSRCSLALIDLRLMDDSDDEDTSGLNLAEEKWPVRSIIFSGHGNAKILLEMMEKHRDLIFISKADARKNIQEKLEREARKLCAVKRGLQIVPAGILQKIEQTSLGGFAADYPDQIADVFARLFPDAQKLRLEKLESRPSSAHISNVPRPKSIILKVYEDEFQPVIVKLARPEKIHREVDRYTRFIAKKLPHGYVPRLERHTILWDIGGAVYTYVGDFSVKTFSQYFEDSAITDIEESLRAFFTETWSAYYSSARPSQQVSLFQLYCNVWGPDWYEKRVREFEMPAPADLNAIHANLDTPDPIEWLINKVANKNTGSPGSDASRVDETLLAITHGDLHGENLLIDRKKNAWVIDFERSGEGHALQDFIELESDLLNRLVFTGEDTLSFYRLCVIMVRQDEIGPIPLDELVPGELEVQKILKTMSILRELALECTGITDMRQYLLGLFFNAIFRATIIASDDQHARSQQRSLMLASIICHRLEHWGEAWPPVAWKTISST